MVSNINVVMMKSIDSLEPPAFAQLAFKSTGKMPFDRVLQANEDAKLYNTDADDKAEGLDIEIAWEKQSQKRQKAECRKATEKWDKRRIVSRQERKETFMTLADQLTSSEWCNYLDDLEKLDMAQKF